MPTKQQHPSLNSVTISILCHEQTDFLSNTVKKLLTLKWITHIQLVDTSQNQKCKNISQISNKKSDIQYLHKPTQTKSFNFSDVRNGAIEAITTQWVLFLDSDERLDAAALESLRTFLNSDNQSTTYQGAFLKRVDIFRGKRMHFGETGNQKLLRLALTQHAHFNRPVHEVLTIQSETDDSVALTQLEGHILHYSHPSLFEFIQSVSWYALLESKQRRWGWKSLLELLTFPSLKFVHNYILKQGYRDGYAGLCYAVAMSLHSLFVRVYTFERHKKIHA